MIAQSAILYDIVSLKFILLKLLPCLPGAGELRYSSSSLWGEFQAEPLFQGLCSVPGMVKQRTLVYGYIHNMNPKLLHLHNYIILIKPGHAEFISVNINIFLHFQSLLSTELTQVVKIFTCGRQESIYLPYSIPWLLMTWRRKEPGHQQPEYW